MAALEEGLSQRAEIKFAIRRWPRGPRSVPPTSSSPPCHQGQGRPLAARGLSTADRDSASLSIQGRVRPGSSSDRCRMAFTSQDPAGRAPLAQKATSGSCLQQTLRSPIMS